MIRFSRIFAVALALVGASAPRVVADRHEDVSLDQIPEKARTMIEKQVGDGQIQDIDREKRDNMVVFEVEYKDVSGREFEMMVAEDGRLLDKRPE